MSWLSNLPQSTYSEHSALLKVIMLYFLPSSILLPQWGYPAHTNFHIHIDLMYNVLCLVILNPIDSTSCKKLGTGKKIVTMLLLRVCIIMLDGASGICEISQWNYKVKSTVCCSLRSISSAFLHCYQLEQRGSRDQQMTGVREICEKNICNDAGCVYNMHEEHCLFIYTTRTTHSVSHTKNTV